MPVLVEAATLVAPEAALRPALRSLGGVAALGALAEASDGALLALTFPPGLAAARALPRLEREGLWLQRDGEAGELAAVGQRMGPAGWWPWLELAVVEGPGPGAGPVLAARLAGGDDRTVAAPAGWRFEGSASQRLGAAALRLVDRPLRHVRREPAGDLYRDRWTGEAVRLTREHAPARVRVEGPGDGGGEVLAELVSREAEIEVGLMFRETLAPGEGMLFRFDRPEHHRFWMKNTLVPLDLLFVADDGRVTGVAAGVPPLTQRHRWSAGPVRAVLEVPGGWCATHAVGAGARVQVVAPPVR